MPSRRQYNLVADEVFDTRIPLHSDDLFQHGIPFNVKYIGSLDVPRPTSRVEIVAAMRRIRYEFKARASKKKKVTLTVSVDGIKVVGRRNRNSQKDFWEWDENANLVLNHPIYRIFYVSHDSHDLKIFSFISREGGTSVFKCNVFKSNKKSQAAEIVRTVGQAFEVCHKLNQQRGLSQENESSNKLEKEIEDEKKVTPHDSGQTIISTQSKQPQTPSVSEAPPPFGAPELEPSASLSYMHQLQLLKAQMEYQAQTAQQAITQVKLLREQLSAENAARVDAMSQNQLLTQQNRELIQHIQILVKQIQELEISRQTSAMQEVSLSPIRANNAPSVFDFPSTPTSQHGQTSHMWLNVGPPSGGSSPRPPASPNVPSSMFADLNKYRLEERLNSSMTGTLPPIGSWSAGTSPLSSLPPLVNGYGTLPPLSSATPSPFVRQYSLPVPDSKTSYPSHPTKTDMSRLTISESVIADTNGVPPFPSNGRNRSPTMAPDTTYSGSVFLS